MQPEFRCNMVVTLEVIYLGTQLEFWYFVLWGFYSLALNLSIVSHLIDSQRLNVSCILVVTLEVTYLGTQFKFWYFVLWRFYSSALNLSIMAHSLLPLGSHLRSNVPWHST